MCNSHTPTPTIQSHTTHRRSWDLFSHYQGVDASCGAANHLSRVLVTLTCGFPRPRLCKQEGVPVDNLLLTRPLDQALDPTCLPQYIKLLHDDRAAAVAGFVYANGHFRVWCGREFARRFFSAEQANARLAEARVLPAFLLGDALHPKDRPGFYEKLAKHMFTRSDEAREVFSVADVRALLHIYIPRCWECCCCCCRC